MTLLRWHLTAAMLLMTGPAWAAPGDAARPDTPFVPASVDAEGARVVEGINRFTLDLYRRALKPNENIVLSPASVSAAVALAYRGAKGITADELRKTLLYSTAPDAYLRAQAPVLRAMDLHAEGRELRTANALWLERDLPLRPEYLADMTAYATAGVQRVDYRQDA